MSFGLRRNAAPHSPYSQKNLLNQSAIDDNVVERRFGRALHLHEILEDSLSTPYVGQLLLVGFNFAPVNYRFCDGGTLPISEYDALFALIGTTYGGDGVINFNVPDLRGRVTIDQGTGQGLSTYVMGQRGGVESVTLTG